MVFLIFQCTQCGECCRNIGVLDIMADLDDGRGVCRYLVGNRCSIYINRPMRCRVDECYDLYYKDAYSRDEFYQMNYDICKMLKDKKNVSG